MHDPALYRYSTGDCAPPGPSRTMCVMLYEFGRQPDRGSDMIPAISQPQDESIVTLANPRRRFDQRLKHPIKLRIRLADDLEHVAGRGLVFERLKQIAGASAQLVE